MTEHRDDPARSVRAPRSPLAKVTAVLAMVAALGLAGAAGAAGAGPGATAAPTVSHTIAVAPTVRVGNGPDGLAVDPRTHTLYVSNQNDNSVSVVSTLRCRAETHVGCGQRVHSIALGANANPQGIALDPATGTAYVADLGSNVISVIDLRTCNATDFAGCRQIPATVPDPRGPLALAVDQRTDTIYVADTGDDFSGLGDTVSVIDGVTCNGQHTAGCDHPTPTVKVGGGPDGVAVDEVTDTVYAADAGTNNAGDHVSVFDGATCNSARLTGCGQTAASVRVGIGPFWISVDHATHSAYTSNNTDNTVSLIDTTACNATRHSGCSQKAVSIPVGAKPYALTIDSALHTVFDADNFDDTLTAINAATCDAATRSGCRRHGAAAQVGRGPQALVTDASSATIYAANFVDNTVSVIDPATCTGAVTSGCRHDEPVAAVGAGPSGLALDQQNHTVYVANATSDTVSVIDADACNAARLRGCRHPVATVRLDSVKAAIGPGGIAVDEATGTVYVANFGSDTVSVIDARTCNATRTSGCRQHPRKIRVGSGPFAVAVDPSTDTVYVADPGPRHTNDTVSVINGATCNASHHGGCGQTAATVTVGLSPRGLAVDEATHTVYVADTGNLTILGDTVSVINAATCNGVRHSGCAARPATIRVGRYPFGVAVDQATNTIYVADNENDDGPDGLSIINGSTCDASHPAGCAHPTGTVNEPGRSARNVALDPSTDTLYVVEEFDASVTVIDLAKPASIPRSPRLAVGSMPEAIVLDPANHTVYVADEADNTLSVLPS